LATLIRDGLSLPLLAGLGFAEILVVMLLLARLAAPLALAGEVADDDGPAGGNDLGGDDGLPGEVAVEDFADDFELREFGHGQRGLRA
jgi:hypothetical protein